jgi:lipid-binding SYLF domain-containing protein
MRKLTIFSSTPLLLAAMAFSLAACDQDDDIGGIDEPVAGVNDGIVDDDFGVGDRGLDNDIDDRGFGDDRDFGDDGALADADSGDLDDAQETVSEAVAVVNQMRLDTELADTLAQAQGVFIVPDYAQAAVIVGGEGGEGVALLRQGTEPGGEWSAPAFYNFGGISVGAEAGVEAGSIAMLLMTEEAVEKFKADGTDFSLDANAGLTIVNWSEKAEGDAGEGDVIVWSDTEGLFAGANIAITGIKHDDDESAAYYGEDVDSQQIFGGNVTDDRSQTLRDALSG